jgi:hypothetical protein
MYSEHFSIYQFRAQWLACMVWRKTDIVSEAFFMAGKKGGTQKVDFMYSYPDILGLGLFLSASAAHLTFTVELFSHLVQFQKDTL